MESVSSQLAGLLIGQQVHTALHTPLHTFGRAESNYPALICVSIFGLAVQNCAKMALSGGNHRHTLPTPLHPLKEAFVVIFNAYTQAYTFTLYLSARARYFLTQSSKSFVVMIQTSNIRSALTESHVLLCVEKMNGTSLLSVTSCLYIKSSE